MRINPWLAEKVKEYRNLNEDSVLHGDYEIAVRCGSKLSWEQHLAFRAMCEALKADPYLVTIRRNMDLPSGIIIALYDCHVDCVADLLQLSEEELSECARVHEFETGPVKKYLKKHGYKLRSCKERTYKIQSLHLAPALALKEFRTWALSSPGAEMEFDLTRPLNYGQWWVEKYYSQYEYTEGEELLKSDWRGLKPALSGDLPYDYKEFFTAVRTFYDCYDAICAEQNIGRCHFILYDLPTKSKELAFIDNNDLLFIKKNYVSALISIFERTSLFQYHTPGQFLAATDEQKLNIAEQESKNETFQLLLITYVELRIDFENLLNYFKELSGRPVRPISEEDKPRPMNTSLEKAIMDYRKRHSDEELREEYRKYAFHTPGKSWEDFLTECALVESKGAEGITIEKDRVNETLNNCHRRAKEAVESEPGLLQTRREKAFEILSAADGMACKFDCDARTHERVLRYYAMLLEEHMLAFPAMTKEAPEVAGRLLTLMKAVYGEHSRQTAGGCRINASIQSKLGHYHEAADYYLAAADIMASVYGPDTLWRGKDLRSAAVCRALIPDYEKALTLLFQAATVFKNYPDEPRELEETYWNIAECYHQLKDKANEEKYRLLAAAIRTTDEI